MVQFVTFTSKSWWIVNVDGIEHPDGAQEHDQHGESGFEPVQQSMVVGPHTEEQYGVHKNNETYRIQSQQWEFDDNVNTNENKVFDTVN